MNTLVQDLRISGAGSAGGGKYNTVSISGSGKIHGDIDCESINVSGSGSITGNILAKTVHTSGASSMKGNVEAFSIRTSGSSKFHSSVMAKEFVTSGASHVLENLNCETFKSSGSTKVDGNLNASEVKTSGALGVGKDCAAENFNASGSVKIGGLLNADNIHLDISYSSSIREIGGERVTIKEHRLFGFFRRLLNLFFARKVCLQADLIEGDEIYLEATKAKLVRGKNIIIGRKCEIEKVEYSGTLDLQDNAKVNDQVKI